MQHPIFYPAGCTEACRCAAAYLSRAGVAVIDHPSPDITHLLLDVPGFAADGKLRSGEDPEALFSVLSDDIILVGGNIPEAWAQKYRTLDLLRNEDYLAENAAITAECALMVGAEQHKRTYRGSKVMIIGWGRIGKYLTRDLIGLGAKVSIVSGTEAHRAEIAALGLTALRPEEAAAALPDHSVIFNTAPQMTLRADVTDRYPNMIKVELASVPGMEGSGIVKAGGLPGKYAPETSGALIARTILHSRKEGKL